MVQVYPRAVFGKSSTTASLLPVPRTLSGREQAMTVAGLVKRRTTVVLIEIARPQPGAIQRSHAAVD